MERFIQLLSKTNTIIKKEQQGSSMVLIIKDSVDIDYPDYYKITIKQEYC